MTSFIMFPFLLLYLVVLFVRLLVEAVVFAIDLGKRNVEEV